MITLVSTAQYNANTNVQCVYADVTYSGATYHITLFEPVSLSGAALQQQLEAKEQDCIQMILQSEYPDRPVDVNTKAEIETWVAGGAVLTSEDGVEFYAEKVQFAGSHPQQKTVADVITDSTVADDLASATTIAGIKAALVKLLASPIK